MKSKRIKCARYGHKRNDDGTIGINEEEQKVIALIRQLATGGMSANAIARELIRRKIPTRTMSGKWGHQQIIMILDAESIALERYDYEPPDQQSIEYEQEIERRKAELLPRMREEKDRIAQQYAYRDPYTVPQVQRPVQRRGVHLGY